MAWFSKKHPVAVVEPEQAVASVIKNGVRNGVTGPRLAVLTPDIAGISSFRLNLQDHVSDAEGMIAGLRSDVRRGTHAFWAMHGRPAVDESMHVEALVLIRAKAESDLVYVVSFIDLESALSFTRFETRRGLYIGNVMIYWAAFTQIREELEGVSVLPSVAPPIDDTYVRPDAGLAPPLPEARASVTIVEPVAEPGREPEREPKPELESIAEAEARKAVERYLQENPEPVAEERTVIKESVAVIEPPVIEQPVVEQARPVIEPPVIEQARPVVEPPVVEQAPPVIEQPVIEPPVIEESVAAIEPPVIEETRPVIEAPVVEQVMEPTVMDEEPAPVIEVPIFDDEPVSEEAAVADALVLQHPPVSEIVVEFEPPTEVAQPEPEVIAQADADVVAQRRPEQFAPKRRWATREERQSADEMSVVGRGSSPDTTVQTHLEVVIQIPETAAEEPAIREPVAEAVPIQDVTVAHPPQSVLEAQEAAALQELADRITTYAGDEEAESEPAIEIEARGPAVDPANGLPQAERYNEFDIALEVERLLKNRKWQSKEGPFRGFKSPPGRF